MKPGLALLMMLGLLGCKRLDMYTQNKYKTWDRSDFFHNGQSMRAPVPGTIARHRPDAPVAEPATIDAALVARGRQRYDIFCSPCHSRAGNGEGMIVKRGFPQPPSFYSARLRQAPAQHYYDVIEHGYGAMYSYADRVPPADRWAIIAYIRALQLSQDAQVAQLPPQDLQKLRQP